jgi:cytochrome oxidase assembly protein ShyY1
MTVSTFANNHRQYALTGFALALMLAGGVFLVLHFPIRSRTRSEERRLDSSWRSLER